MYLLYLDESGNENDPGNHYFVLAGLALFERQIHHLNERLSTCRRSISPTGHQSRFTHRRSERGEDSGVALASPRGSSWNSPKTTLNE